MNVKMKTRVNDKGDIYILPLKPFDKKSTQKVCREIVCERERQYEKFGDQSKLTQSELLAILTEEIGEYAHEVCEGIRKPFNRERAREELIQIAAVAVQIVEIIDKG